MRSVMGSLEHGKSQLSYFYVWFILFQYIGLQLYVAVKFMKIFKS